jgi:lipopolysaccharide/colanic/teichoic acid biosynthesis glycosyltransferase
MKRLIDITGSAAALMALLPLLCVIAIAIRLESSGSPFFLQQRVGRNGKLFAIFKFRSMVKNAPSLGVWYTRPDDPRITRVGKFLRFTSLDELPQLANVFLGDMSLIGPRPAVAAQQADYSQADWELRHTVRPGITGLSQVSGRSGLSQEEQTRYDLHYATQHTLRMDFMILLKTIRVVLFRVGVN